MDPMEWDFLASPVSLDPKGIPKFVAPMGQGTLPMNSKGDESAIEGSTL